MPRVLSQYVSIKGFLLLILEAFVTALCLASAVKMRFWSNPADLVRYVAWPGLYRNNLYDLNLRENSVDGLPRVEQSLGAASLLLFYVLFLKMMLSRYVLPIGMLPVAAFWGFGWRPQGRGWQLSALAQRIAVIGTGRLALEAARELTRRTDPTLGLEGFLSAGYSNREPIFGAIPMVAIAGSMPPQTGVRTLLSEEI